uniref:RRM domain-containing protein n=1 Tax=Hyaloperonospora arabidopsidis (strain Emoy2) TaxID=559515 RepID=M4C174_HYAAE
MASTSMKSKKRSRDTDAKAATLEASASSTSSGSCSESSSDSDDEKVANAMFRPAPKQETGAESERLEQRERETEGQKRDVVQEERKQKKKKGKKTEEEQPQGEEDGHLKEEIDRKTEATVYVEGIPYRATESDLVTHFTSCGTVREVRMPRYQDSGKPRGYAHVVFDDEVALEKALLLDKSYLFQRYLSIERAEAPRAVEMALKEKNQNATKKAIKGCRTVYIKQLPYEVEEDTIREALASCGTITSVRLPIWNHTQKLKGFGYVEFSSEDEALAAARRSGMKIGDRMVLISLDAVGSAPKASFRQRDGQYWNKGEEAKKSLAKKISEKQQRQSAAKKRKTSTR